MICQHTESGMGLFICLDLTTIGKQVQGEREGKKRVEKRLMKKEMSDSDRIALFFGAKYSRLVNYKQ